MEYSFVWRLLLLASLFVFPQLLGVLLCLRLSRFPRWIGRVLGVVVPALSFFFLAPHFFFAGLREAALKGEVNCGMPAVAAAFMLLLGTGIHLLIAFVIQLRLTRT
jgi:hypothetical protein